MDCGDKNVEGSSSSIELPDEFITKLITWLETTQDIDPALLNVLKDHLLKKNPAHDAVGEAAKALWKLAADRTIEDTDA
ncbi:MAG: hypothetical protein L6277_08085 [Desulfobacterales bacterium]|nr:hypothetical protein [Pseudomonadota bacterium]MBU4355016.1 hypothetical protein [Pseudomonadota bacterium]MCG2772031.1 hypothetical protein [Desulfobacterales bacterium]